MEVIDFHSHVLPGIDDGSRNIETSIEMLRLSRNAGVDRMIATPHFYADEDRIEHFLEKREHAYQRLKTYRIPHSFCLERKLLFLMGSEMQIRLTG